MTKDSTNIRAVCPSRKGGGGREDNHHNHGRGSGGEYDDNEDSGLMIQTRVSVCLPEAMFEINFGYGDDNNDDKNHHHHYNNRVSIVGRIAAVSSALTRSHQRPCR